jgi:dTDP-4-dehydrorhamnose reductase
MQRMAAQTISKAVVTGGTGYIGSVMTDFLRRGAGVRGVLPLGSADLDIIDRVSVVAFMQREKPDVVIHLAAKAETDWVETHFEEALRVNVDGAVNVVRAALDVGARVAYFSSACLYPDNRKPHGESSLMAALCKYTETKLQAERALASYAQRVLIVRMRQPFSNHRHPRNLLEKLARCTAFIDEPNSMTHLEEGLPIVWRLLQDGVAGPINITNQGWTTPYRIAMLIREHLRPEMTAARISYDELLAQVVAVRVNSLVDNARLQGLGHRLKPVEDAVVDCLLHACSLGEFDWRTVA